jgi:hypothetical protein
VILLIGVTTQRNVAQCIRIIRQPNNMCSALVWHNARTYQVFKFIRLVKILGRLRTNSRPAASHRPDKESYEPCCFIGSLIFIDLIKDLLSRVVLLGQVLFF